MNHISQRLKVGKAIEGFLQAKAAEALSPRTIEIYTSILEQWHTYAGDVAVSRITPQDIRAYLAYLRTSYVPRRLSGKKQPLSPKTIRNIYIALASLFSWLNREFGLESPVKAVVPPAFVARVAHLVLNWPRLGALLIAVTGLLVAVFSSILYADPSNFVGIAIGGAVTTTIVHFGTDLIWRQQVPAFFPAGVLSAVPTYRPWVRRRLLLAFSLMGGLTPILLVILSQVCTRALLEAANPKAMLTISPWCSCSFPPLAWSPVRSRPYSSPAPLWGRCRCCRRRGGA